MGANVKLAGGVASPCINVCRMDDATGLCAGCWRTLDEIAAWSTMDDPAKHAVWTLLDGRRAEHPEIAERFDD
jgi:predicted Fe-S protein YdhL (DUF1289 family)